MPFWLKLEVASAVLSRSPRPPLPCLLAGEPVVPTGERPDAARVVGRPPGLGPSEGLIPRGVSITTSKVGGGTWL